MQTSDTIQYRMQRHIVPAAVWNGSMGEWVWSDRFLGMDLQRIGDNGLCHLIYSQMTSLIEVHRLIYFAARRIHRVVVLPSSALHPKIHFKTINRSHLADRMISLTMAVTRFSSHRQILNRLNHKNRNVLKIYFRARMLISIQNRWICSQIANRLSILPSKGLDRRTSLVIQTSPNKSMWLFQRQLI